MLFSFWQSVLIFQPLKVLILSVIFAVLFKQPPKIEEVYESQRKIIHKKDNDDDGDINMLRNKIELYRLPDNRRLQEARVKRFGEKRIRMIVREIVVHLSFIALCLMVCYLSVDENSQRLFQSGNDLMGLNGITKSYFGGKTYQSDDRDAEGRDKVVKTGPGVTTRAEWFDWARYSVIEYLFPTGWYNANGTNNAFKYPRDMIADAASSKVLAMARFRQLRLKNEDTCTKHEVFQHLIKKCIGGYSYSNQLNETFNVGWSPYNETANRMNRIGLSKTVYEGLEAPWKYSSMKELDSAPFFGQFAIYDGSSYSVSIGPNKDSAKLMLYAMKDNFWIDRYTRAIFTEANIYNANSNLLLILTLVHEILPTGGWNYFPNVQPIRLFRYVGGHGDVIIFFDIAFVIVMFFGLYKIIKESKSKGCKRYFLNFWNILHIIITLCGTSAFVISVFRYLEVKAKVRQFRDTPEQFVSFSYVGLMENLIIACLGFVLFFKNLEFLRILRFNQQIALTSKTIASLGGPLGSYAMTFFVIFTAFVSLAHGLFADKLEDFRTVMETSMMLSRMFLGQFRINDYFDNAPYLGPVLFFTYMVCIQLVMINLLIGVICDTFAESEGNITEDRPNVVNYVTKALKKIGNKELPLADPIYTEWKDEWTTTMDEITDRCNNCIYALRSMEGEETRQTKFFTQNVDDKKKDVLTAVMGVDFFQYDADFSDGLQVIESKLKNMTPYETKQLIMNAALMKVEENVHY